MSLMTSKFFLNNKLNNNFSVGKYKGKIVFIDAMNRLYKQTIGLISKKAHTQNKEDSNYHIESIFNFTISLIKYGMLPYYVFEGNCPKEKKQTSAKRSIEKKKYLDICKEIDDKKSPEFIKNFKKGFSLKKSHIDDCKLILNLMGLQYIDAEEEADQQCAVLSDYYRKNSAGIISDDWDILMYGGIVVLKDFSLKNANNNNTNEISIEKIIESYKEEANTIRIQNNLPPLELFKHNNFLDFCILLGTDYTVDDKLFKIDENFENLFKICSLNGFDMNLVCDELMLRNKISSKENFNKSLNHIRNIYLHPVVKDPKNINLIPSSVKEDELIKFLCDEKGMDKEYVKEELKNIKINYFALKKICEEKDNKKSMCTMSSYQFNYYIQNYKSDIEMSDKNKNNINNNMNNKIISNPYNKPRSYGFIKKKYINCIIRTDTHFTRSDMPLSRNSQCNATKII
jgi:hypothetical protein